jgi:lysyl-tRNA synthetase class 2
MNWRPSAELDVLKLRARMLQRIRAFFSDRNVLEVETPILSSGATTDPNIESFATRYRGPVFPHGQSLYLHTSPEFAMKRLLAAGSGSIYQICKVFRDGEAGRLHNPEFTMIEWYRVGLDHTGLMKEVAELVTWALDAKMPAKIEYLSYRDAFLRCADIDPHTENVEVFAQCAHRNKISAPNGMPNDNVDPWRDLLLTHIVEPHLGKDGMTFLYDYPASQAALACVRPGNPPLAERFELYIDGIEIANGFHELANADEQRRRFESDLQKRRARGLPALPIDERLLAGLVQGIPDCAGVALGFDRLVMRALGAISIENVLSFPIDRA